MKKITFLLIVGFTVVIVFWVWQTFFQTLKSRVILGPYYKSYSELSFSPGGQVLSLANDGELIIYNILTNKLIMKSKIPPHNYKSGRWPQLLWSPDGEKLTVGIITKDKKNVWVRDYYIFNIIEKRKMLVLQNFERFFWNPDSQRFGTSNGNKSYLGNVSTSEVTPIAKGIDLSILGWLDKNRIVYDMKKQGATWFGVGDLQNDIFKEIKPYRSYININDKKEIISFQSAVKDSKEGGLTLNFVLNGKTKLITSELISGDKLSWSPDGTKMIFTEPEEDKVSIWLYDLKNDRLSEIYSLNRTDNYDIGIDNHIKWTLDSNKIIFVSTKTNYLTYRKLFVNVYDLKTQKSFISKLGLDNIYNLTWSPDGRKLYFADRETNKLMETELEWLN